MVLQITIRPLPVLQTMPTAGMNAINAAQQAINAAQNLAGATNTVNVIGNVGTATIDYNAGIDTVALLGGVKAGKWGFAPNLVSSAGMTIGEVNYRMVSIMNAKYQREYEANIQNTIDDNIRKAAEAKFQKDVMTYVFKSDYDYHFKGIGYTGDSKSIDQVLMAANWIDTYVPPAQGNFRDVRGFANVQNMQNSTPEERKKSAYEKFIPTRDENRKKVQEYIQKKVADKLNTEYQLDILAKKLPDPKKASIDKFAETYKHKKSYQLEKSAIELKTSKTLPEYESKLKAFAEVMTNIEKDYAWDVNKDGMKALTIDAIIGTLSHILKKVPHKLVSGIAEGVSVGAKVHAALTIGQSEIEIVNTVEILKEMKHDFCLDADIYKSLTPLLAEVECNAILE